jgi:hypothetical protein
VDPQGNAIPRNMEQFVETLVHEAAHAWWSYYQGYTDHLNPGGGGTHHSQWQATMEECGYPNATG